MNINPDMPAFITSDLHFWHQGIIRMQPETRLWPSVEEMNNGLLEEINSLPEKAILFHGGDFCFGGKKKVREICGKIRRDIRVIALVGNHDRHNRGVLRQYFDMHDYLEFTYQQQKICFFHYPIINWNCKYHGSLHFHGHEHGSTQRPGYGMIDVGYDAHGRILSFHEAFEKAQEMREQT